MTMATSYNGNGNHIMAICIVPHFLDANVCFIQITMSVASAPIPHCFLFSSCIFHA